MEGCREKDNSKIIGICSEARRILGPGLLEILYKDVVKIEFKNHNIPLKGKRNLKLKM